MYFKTDPDPFDDRHPGRADPNCTLGHVLKIILKNDDFIQAVSPAVVIVTCTYSTTITVAQISLLLSSFQLNGFNLKVHPSSYYRTEKSYYSYTQTYSPI